MERKLRIGMVETQHASRAVLTVEVEYTAPGGERFGQVRPDGSLAFSATLERPNARDIDAGGQLQDEMRHMLLEEAIDFAPGWNAAQLTRLLDTWDRWHLNDMRTGCEHQRALGWTYDEHPSEPCPECGYRMGSAWLSEPVPVEVVAYLRGLPNGGAL